MKKKLSLIIISLLLLTSIIFADKFILVSDSSFKVYRLEAYDSFELTGDALTLKKADSLWSGSDVSVKINLVTELELQKYQQLEQMLKEGRTLPVPTKPGEPITGKIITVEWLKEDKKRKVNRRDEEVPEWYKPNNVWPYKMVKRLGKLDSCKIE